ncbi:MAG: hypothetical protein KJ624_08120 [Chloroflexi bacterium]|nr:hypothetical protein [Chloroflexota bacterium]
MKKGKDTLNMLRATQAGRKISVIEPFSAPWLSARVVNGHLPLLRRRSRPLNNIEATATNTNTLKALVMPAYSR